MKTTVTASASIPKDWWRGRILTRYDSQYTWVALEFNDGAVIVLSVDEVNVGRWFEVFPLSVESSVPDFLSNYVFLGPGPHFVQNAAPIGEAPASTEAFVVEAGIEIQGTDGSVLIICSSCNTPFKVDFATGAGEIEQIQQFHTVQ